MPFLSGRTVNEVDEGPQQAYGRKGEGGPGYRVQDEPGEDPVSLVVTEDKLGPGESPGIIHTESSGG